MKRNTAASPITLVVPRLASTRTRTAEFGLCLPGVRAAVTGSGVHPTALGPEVAQPNRRGDWKKISESMPPLVPLVPETTIENESASSGMLNPGATEIVGDGALSLSDRVIPNSIATAPLGGTEPLFKVLALQPLTATGAASHHAARFVAGGHSSLLAPDEDFDPTGAVTTEMQTQFGSFFASDGALVKVTDASLLKQ